MFVKCFVNCVNNVSAILVKLVGKRYTETSSANSAYKLV